jgi:hypothetical protein
VSLAELLDNEESGNGGPPSLELERRALRLRDLDPDLWAPWEDAVEVEPTEDEKRELDREFAEEHADDDD